VAAAEANTAVDARALRKRAISAAAEFSVMAGSVMQALRKGTDRKSVAAIVFSNSEFVNSGSASGLPIQNSEFRVPEIGSVHREIA
jgi:hypothetical protein